MAKERVGIIDIGTNTFNLIVVEKDKDGFEKLYKESVGVGLGLGGINKGVISLDAMKRGKETLESFLKTCEEMEVLRAKAFATSAVRDAGNKEEFISMVGDLGLDIEVITGQREAALIHQGVKLGYPFEDSALIMDIGGGSTEFIYADKNEVLKSKSFNIGTARIYQMFDFEDPYSEKNIDDIINYLETNTLGYFDDINTDVLIGASGSFETFYAILFQNEYPENEFEDMSTNDLSEVLEEMIHSTLKERMNNPFIIPIRKKMAPIAAIKIKWIIDKLNIKTLTISPFAMKEGVIQLV